MNYYMVFNSNTHAYKQTFRQHLLLTQTHMQYSVVHYGINIITQHRGCILIFFQLNYCNLTVMFIKIKELKFLNNIFRI